MLKTILPTEYPVRKKKKMENATFDLISRQAAIDAIVNNVSTVGHHDNSEVARYGAIFRQHEILDVIERLPSAQPEHLTDDDFETIRIHLSAYKEKLCNQRRWNEAEEYQRIIDRFMAFASAQPERKKGHWVALDDEYPEDYECDVCGYVSEASFCMSGVVQNLHNFCPNCGADMRGEQDG